MSIFFFFKNFCQLRHRCKLTVVSTVSTVGSAGWSISYILNLKFYSKQTCFNCQCKVSELILYFQLNSKSKKNMFGTAKAASTSTRVSPPIARKGSHQAPQKAVTLSQIEFPSVESVQRDKDTRVSQPIARHISHQAPQKAVSTLSTLSQVEFPSTDAVQNPHDLSRSTLSTEEGRTLKQKWNKAADATSTAAAKHDRVAETYFTQSHTRTSGLRSSSKKAATHRGAKNLAHDSSAQATAYSLSDNHTLGERVVAICIQGGGIKGACYSGLVEAFELHGMKLRPPGLDRHNPDDHNDVLVASDPDDPDIVRKFSGTSAGSVCAAGLALGFSAQRIASAIENMPW